jgi:arginase family enzyme
MTLMKVTSQPTAVRREASLDEVSEGAVTFVGAPIDPAPGHRSSTALGPNALRLALDDVLSVFLGSSSGAIEDKDSGTTVKLNPATPLLDVGDLVSPFSVDTVKSVIELTQSSGAIPIVLGGSRDLVSPCLESVASLDAEIACVHLSPKMLPGDRVQGVSTCFVGINSLIPQALWDDASAANAPVICAGQVYEEGVEVAIQSLRAFLQNQESVFWHIDAAVVDSGHAAGTPDLNIGGLSPEQLLAVLDGVAQETRVVGCVVTNVAPSFDKRGLSEFVAAEALLRVLSPRLVSSEA